MAKKLSQKWRNWREQVRSRADFLTRTLSLESLPISLAGLAAECKVGRVIFRPMLVDGGLSKAPDGFWMYVGCDEDEAQELSRKFSDHNDGGKTLPARMRFTIAHELIHTFFFDVSRGEPQSRVSGSHYRELGSLERECNRGAARLLVPERLLHQAINAGPIDVFEPEELTALARRFRVSLETLLRCLQPLGLRSPDNGGVFYLCEDKDRLLVSAFALTGPAYGSLPNIQFGAEAKQIAYHPDLLVFGGNLRKVSIDVEYERGGKRIRWPWRLACECVGENPRRFVLTVRFSRDNFVIGEITPTRPSSSERTSIQARGIV